jgi:hypothetical protein
MSLRDLERYWMSRDERKTENPETRVAPLVDMTADCQEFIAKILDSKTGYPARIEWDATDGITYTVKPVYVSSKGRFFQPDRKDDWRFLIDDAIGGILRYEDGSIVNPLEAWERALSEHFDTV